MEIITLAELRSILLTKTAQSFVSFVAVTEPKMLAKSKDGTPNPYKIGKSLKDGLSVCKVNKVNGTINPVYDRMVDNRLARQIIADRSENNLPPLTPAELEKEIDALFEKGESWHRPIIVNGKPSCLSVNKNDSDDGEAYIRFVIRSGGDSEYVNFDGSTEIATNISPFLSPPSSYSNQGLENTVKFMVYKLSNIVEISIDGNRYRISDNLTSLNQPVRQTVWNIAEDYVSGDRKMHTV